jgi:hypothetical protein
MRHPELIQHPKQQKMTDEAQEKCSSAMISEYIKATTKQRDAHENQNSQVQPEEDSHAACSSKAINTKREPRQAGI